MTEIEAAWQAGWEAGARSASRSAAEEIDRLRADVIAFCGVWATMYAKDHGLPDGHLCALHYDILARAGARMDSFTRSEQT